MFWSDIRVRLAHSYNNNLHKEMLRVVTIYAFVQFYHVKIVMADNLPHAFCVKRPTLNQKAYHFSVVIIA